MMTWILGYACLAIAAAGCVYLLCAAVACAKFASGPRPAAAPTPPITILKPLKGAGLSLSRNLATFCAQNYPGPVQLVFGVQNPNDEAIAVVERLKTSFPDQDVKLVVDQAVHGTNLKVSNLINMAPAIRHRCIILADSDIFVRSDYLLRVTAALQQPGVSGVTCLYHGVPTAGFWSELSALAIDTHFVPNVLVGLLWGLASPCLGSTIALWTDHLHEIGGFRAFADRLADDYAVGTALRGKGHRIAIPPLFVEHVCAESSLSELWRHELRWARTIRTVDPHGYAGSLVTHPFAFALMALAAGAPVVGSILAILAIFCRIVLLHVTTRHHWLAPSRYWLVPIRDLFSFALFVWSSCGRGLTWGDRNYRVRANGTLTADREA